MFALFRSFISGLIIHALYSGYVQGMLVISLGLLCLSGAAVLEAQGGTATNDSAVHVFIDCAGCDREYIRTELPYLTYVRQRQQADVHILITHQGTGGGGTEYTLTFLGQKQFRGTNDTLQFIADQTQTRDATRWQLVNILELGMVQYLAETRLRDHLDVSFTSTGQATQQQTGGKDTWNKWIYNVSFNTAAHGQQSIQSVNVSGSANAHRVTREWKFMVLVTADYTEDLFRLDTGNYTSISRNRQFRGAMVNSLSSHFSAGLWSAVRKSTYENLSTEGSLGPRIEYNYFPYNESTRRQLRVIYGVGSRWRDYLNETIYFRTSEQLWRESLTIVLDLVQPWGTGRVSVTGSHYFQDLSQHRIQINGNLSLNVTEGLSLDISGSYSAKHDQRSLPRAEATTEEILLQRRQLQTRYSYSLNIGFSYTFGSIYESVVNPRFGGWWFI